MWIQSKKNSLLHHFINVSGGIQQTISSINHFYYFHFLNVCKNRSLFFKFTLSFWKTRGIRKLLQFTQDFYCHTTKLSRPPHALCAHMHFSRELQAYAVQAKCIERTFIIVSIKTASQLSTILVCGSVHNDPCPIGGLVCKWIQTILKRSQNTVTPTK
jgi:hypothetical protein